MLTSSQRKLVAEVSAHVARHHDGEDHTVAAGLLTESGSVVLGLNHYHFLGGPCGEVTALANHAAQCPNDPIRIVVAVLPAQ